MNEYFVSPECRRVSINEDGSEEWLSAGFMELRSAAHWDHEYFEIIPRYPSKGLAEQAARREGLRRIRTGEAFKKDAAVFIAPDVNWPGSGLTDFS